MAPYSFYAVPTRDISLLVLPASVPLAWQAFLSTLSLTDHHLLMGLDTLSDPAASSFAWQ